MKGHVGTILMPIRFATSLGLVLACIGCATRPASHPDRQNVNVRGILPGDVPEFLVSADTFELLSIEPNGRDKDEFNANGTEDEPRIRGYRIRKTVAVRDAPARQRVVDAIMRSIVTADGTLMCFMPSHAVRASDEDGGEVELILCFGCLSMETYSGWGKTQGNISRHARPCFEEILARDGTTTRPADKTHPSK